MCVKNKVHNKVASDYVTSQHTRGRPITESARMYANRVTDRLNVQMEPMAQSKRVREGVPKSTVRIY